ncbi:MAG: hypothetical protein Q9165_006866 [Trypethelium subeluteriae]
MASSQSDEAFDREMRLATDKSLRTFEAEQSAATSREPGRYDPGVGSSMDAASSSHVEASREGPSRGCDNKETIGTSKIETGTEELKGRSEIEPIENVPELESDRGEDEISEDEDGHPKRSEKWKGKQAIREE